MNQTSIPDRGEVLAVVETYLMGVATRLDGGDADASMDLAPFVDGWAEQMFIDDRQDVRALKATVARWVAIACRDSAKKLNV